MNTKSLYKAHPWHGVEIGEEAPDKVMCYIEIVPTDTVKFELDKESGILRVDRPQRYSNYCPSLYGFIPKTYCGNRVGAFCSEKTEYSGVEGDGDPLDICVFCEKSVVRGDLLVKAKPIGGMRLIDGRQADDKILAVMEGDYLYREIDDVKDCSENMLDRISHYFLTYKDSPGNDAPKSIEITHIYGKEEACKIINLAIEDYEEKFA